MGRLLPGSRPYHHLPNVPSLTGGGLAMTESTPSMNSNAITQSTYSVPISPNVVGSAIEIEVTKSESRPNSPKKKM
ncbi:hypothetical protein QJS10_CPB11g00626 [Acorus calamus]|uniref:Uncharacterized protein n=1 Tax=Acorus calamus TaxID=4465 RepID=A0AAV9DSQ2_ACOCL|nr:hypothetical protein QJS10_CPB11g00626 [Acorus calamus]